MPDSFPICPVSSVTLKYLTEQQLSMMCSPGHPSKHSSYQTAFSWHSDLIVTCTYKQVPMLALTPPFYEKQKCTGRELLRTLQL